MLAAFFITPACVSRTMFVGRYDASLTLDETFADDGLYLLDVAGVDNVSWTPQGLVVQADGHIVVGGSGGRAGNGDFFAARLRGDGSLDASFGNNGVATVDLGYTYEWLQSLRMQTDGKLLLAGEVADAPADESHVGVARLLADGAPDPTFGAGGVQVLDLLVGQEIVNGAVPLGDGRLRLCGHAWDDAADPDLVVYGLLADGSVDSAFGSSGVVLLDFFGSDEFGGACEAGGGGSVLVPGMALASSDFDAVVARVTTDGTPDPSFGDGTTGLPGRASLPLAGSDDACDAVARLADGSLLCGNGANRGGTSDSLLVRFTEAGTLDPSFGVGGRVVLDLGGNDHLRAVQPLPSGRIVAAGSRTNAAGDQDFAVAILTPDGALDATAGTNIDEPGLSSFDITPGQDDEATSVAIDAEGRLLVFGRTTDGISSNIALLRLWL
jgi:uncharacterized delta-60 repeat protein